MNIVFRADSSVDIGVGHVMRSLSLATVLARRGAHVTFVCRELPGNVSAQVTASGFALKPIPAAGSTWSWEEDARLTAAALEGARADWLVVDHYGLDARWEEKLRPHAARLMAIDDLADRPHSCDLLLDQSYVRGSADRYATLVPNNCRRLLGPRFALLRERFRDPPGASRPRAGEVGRILILFGGTDPGNETAKAIEAIRLVADPKLRADVIVGSTNPHRNRLEELARTIPNITLHSQVNDVERLMAECDLAIGASGSTTWERCRMGLPCIAISIADNQSAVLAAMAADGLLVSLGLSQNVTAVDIARAIAELRAAPARVATLSRRCQALVDGQGADRVAETVLNP